MHSMTKASMAHEDDTSELSSITDASEEYSSRLSRQSQRRLSRLTVNKLRFENLPLYGREEEIQTLKKTFEQSRKSRQFVLIEGAPGTGKSVLARELKPLAKRCGGFYLTGKNDCNQLETPLHAFSRICEHLCQAIYSLPGRDVSSGSLLMFPSFEEIQTALRCELGCDMKALGTLAPCLLSIVGVESFGAQSNCDFDQSKGLFHDGFRRLMRTIASFRPLILVIDDLQWADVASLELLESLASDPESQNILIVGTYRAEEVDSKHALAKLIPKLQKSPNAPEITSLHLQDLDVDQLNAMLVDLLNVHGDQALDLAECVHKKTLGNPFFSIQFLRLLTRKDLLGYNFGTMTWHWDVKNIQNATVATDNVVNLVKENLRNMSQKCLDLLPLLACLGSLFSRETADLVINHFESKDFVSVDLSKEPSVAHGSRSSLVVYEILTVCVEAGILQKEGGNIYRWVHDKIQEAVLSLLNEEDLVQTQQELGELLLENWSDEQVIANIFLVVDLLGKGGGSVSRKTEAEKLRMAQLYLDAGERAIQTSSFVQASRYLDTGVTLLPENCWEKHYELSRNLYSAAAEAFYSTGEVGKAESCCSNVIKQEGHPILDKRRAYTVSLCLLSAQGREIDAQNRCLEILAKLGVHFPKVGKAFAVVFGLLRANVMQKKIIDSLTVLSDSRDESQVWAQLILDKLVIYSYRVSGSLYVPLGIFKLLQVTLKQGINEFTPPSLATIGLLFVAALNDYDGAKAFASKAIELLDKKENDYRTVEARTRFAANGFVLHWTMPLESCMKGLVIGYEKGLAAAETEFTAWCRYSYLEYSVMFGKRLEDVCDQLELSVSQTNAWNQLKINQFTRLLHQLALNLKGENLDSLRFTGRSMDEDTFVKQCLETKNENSLLVLSCNRLYIAFLLDNFEAAYAELVKSNMHKGYLLKAMPGTITITYMYFYCAMTCISMASKVKKNSSKKKFKKQAKYFSQTISDWMDAGNPNVNRYDEMLKAEFAVIDERIHRALHHYENAIRLSGRRGVRNDQATAYQRRGEFYLRECQMDEARYDINKAIVLFEDWGAIAKVNQLHEKHQNLLGPPSNLLTSFEEPW